MRQKREQSYTNTPNTCPRWLTAEKSPAAKTAHYVSAPAKYPRGFRALRKKRYVTYTRQPTRQQGLRTRASPLARGGSPSRTPAVETERYVPAPAHLPAVARRREIPRGKNGTLRTRAGPLAGRGSLPFYRNSSERRDSTLGARKSAFTAPSSRTIAREAT